MERVKGIEPSLRFPAVLHSIPRAEELGGVGVGENNVGVTLQSIEVMSVSYTHLLHSTQQLSHLPASQNRSLHWSFVWAPPKMQNPAEKSGAANRGAEKRILNDSFDAGLASGTSQNETDEIEDRNRSLI